MNTLVLIPGMNTLKTSVFAGDRQLLGCSRAIKDYRHTADIQTTFTNILGALGETSRATYGIDYFEVCAIDIPYGGEIFSRPVPVSEDVLERLRGLIDQSPLYIPVILSLIDACRRVLHDSEIVLIFETAFFTKLPPREYMYALPPSVMKTLKIRRFGYHGSFHEAVVAGCRYAGKGTIKSHKLLSVCLEPQPEVAAIIGVKPVMVTSGVSPLEGLPGQTTCGELDPSIVLRLADELGWGPEQINLTLTTQSGLKGLTGKNVTLSDIFSSDASPEYALTRDLIRYQLLQAAGSGMAAMGDIDEICFSGRHAALGEQLAPWLVERLTFKGTNRTRPISWSIYTASHERIIANTAHVMLIQKKMKCRAC